MSGPVASGTHKASDVSTPHGIGNQQSPKGVGVGKTAGVKVGATAPTVGEGEGSRWQLEQPSPLTRLPFEMIMENKKKKRKKKKKKERKKERKKETKNE